MKAVHSLLITAGLFIVLLSNSAFAQDSAKGGKGKGNESNSWEWSPYISAGYGYPQGARFELGYNFGKYVSVAFDVGIYDAWSRNPSNGTFGLVGRVFLPVSGLDFKPYLSIGGGSTFELFGTEDSYTIFFLGAMIPINPWLTFRPEGGIDRTSRYVSGGGLFNGSSNVVTDIKLQPAIHLSLEFDILGLF